MGRARRREDRDRERLIPAMQVRRALRRSSRSPRAIDEVGGAPRPARHCEPMVPTRHCWPIPRSRRSTTRCRTICTCRCRSRRSKAGKHVPCEKPIALNADEAAQLRGARPAPQLILEAFMVRFHPQRLRGASSCNGRHRTRARDPDLFSLLQSATRPMSATRPISAAAGCTTSAATRSSLALPLRGRAARGGGASIDHDPDDFAPTGWPARSSNSPAGAASTFTVATQLSAHQRVTDRPARRDASRSSFPSTPCPMRLCGSSSTPGGPRRRRRPRGGVPGLRPVRTAGRGVFARGARRARPFGVEDAVANMQVIDALFRSERSGTWEPVAAG